MSQHPSCGDPSWVSPLLAAAWIASEGSALMGVPSPELPHGHPLRDLSSWVSPQRSLLRDLPSWVSPKPFSFTNHLLSHHSPLTRAASQISSKGSSSWVSPQSSLLRGLPSWVPHHQSPLTRAAPWTFSKGSSRTGVPSQVFSG